MERREQNDIKILFDSLASSYAGRKEKSNYFLSYFNAQRLSVSVRNLRKEQVYSLLDLGAGTGFLYDYLKGKGFDLSKYLALDISDQMLKQSNIPESQRLIGSVSNIELQKFRTFDCIYCLGLTTYLREGEIQDLLGNVKSLLKPEGKFVVTFTNRSSLDFWLLTFLRKVIPSFLLRNKVLGLDSIYASDPNTLKTKLQQSGLHMESLYYLNQTVFPFNRIFPRLSVRIANRVKDLSSGRLKYWSSDFLIIASKDPE